MNDPQNMPVEPHDDGTVQEDPLYQEPSEGIVTHVEESDAHVNEANSHVIETNSYGDETNSHGDRTNSHGDETGSRRP